MRTIVLSGLLVGLSLVFTGCPGNNIVVFKDKSLENAVRVELGKYFGPITEADMLALRFLDARNGQIRKLDGLEAALNLQWFDASNESKLANTITDLSPITDLRRLEFLNLENNDIFDVGPLAGLFNLDQCYLNGNDIFNLEGLVANSENGGLGEGDTVTLTGAVLVDSEGLPLTDQIGEQLSSLLERGVDVLFVSISQASGN